MMSNAKGCLIAAAVAASVVLPVAAAEFPDPAAFNPTWESAKPGTSYSTDLPTAALLGNTEDRDRMVRKYRRHFPDGKYAAEIGSLPASQAQ